MLSGRHQARTPEGQTPDTVAGEQFEWMLAALSGRPGVVSDMEMSDHFAASALANTSVEELRARLDYWEGRKNTYEFLGTARRDTRTELDSNVLISAGDMGLVQIEVQTEAPHRIERLRIGEPEE